jgi:hypothetical protein
MLQTYMLPKMVYYIVTLPQNIEVTKPILNHQDHMTNREQKRGYLYGLKRTIPLFKRTNNYIIVIIISMAA